MESIYLKLNRESLKVISTKDMEIGDLARVVAIHGCADTTGHILLKTSLGIIDLCDPQKTWHCNTPIDFEVVKLKKGDKIRMNVV